MHISETLDFVKQKHDVNFNQKYGDHPYSFHLEGVTSILCEKYPDVPDYAIHAALLHDIIEDTDTTELDLFDMGYSPETIDIVSKLTHKPNDTYDEYMKKIVESSDVWTKRIKFCDSTFNLNHSPRNPKKYQKNLEMLRAVAS